MDSLEKIQPISLSERLALHLKNKSIQEVKSTTEKNEESQKRQIKLNFHVIVNTDDITDDWTIQRVAAERAPHSWKHIFEELDETFEYIDGVIEKKKQGRIMRIVPAKKDIFNALHWCPLNSVKVVILGQDPYYTLMQNGVPDAVGASFSTRRGARMRESVYNIFLEVKRDYPEFEIPNHGDLIEWAKQGVLLLNMSLTTFAGQDRAHPSIWRGVVKSFLKEVQEVRPNSIALLWGGDAQKFARYLGKMTYLTAAHPSPKSANRGFFGCSHFKLANEHLVSRGLTPIDWTKLD